MDITSACPVAFLKVTVQGQKLVSLGIATICVGALFFVTVFMLEM